VKEINDAGGIKSLGGAKLKLLDADSEGKPELAISAVERLNREGGRGCDGGLPVISHPGGQPAGGKAAGPLCGDRVAVADEVTSRGFKYTFRVQPKCGADGLPDREIHQVKLRKAAGQTVKTIAYLHDDTAFGVSLSGHVKKHAPKYGMEVIVAKVPYSPRAADVSTEVGKIKAAGADVVMATGYFGDGVRVLKTMKDMRVQGERASSVAETGRLRTPSS
jgi:branched-chain amino acid transport system substrate-binding protein